MPNLSIVTEISPEILGDAKHAELGTYLEDARAFLLGYRWCERIDAAYVGMLVEGVFGIFLFRITPAVMGVDEWLWVVAGDLPPAYLTCEDCPNPAAALDGYIGAMAEWADAAADGRPVDGLIPVNVPPTAHYAQMLRTRLAFLDEEILSQYDDDLAEPGHPPGGPT